MEQNFFKEEKKYFNPYIKKMDDYKQYILYENEKIIDLKGKWNQKFKNKNEINVELGSGSGNFLIKTASENPQNLYIGFELRFKRLVYAARKAAKLKLSNIIFLRKKAQEIGEVFETEEIFNIYIFFPEPWEKMKRRKNRVLNKDMLEQYKKILKNNGNIFFRTDHEDYFKDVCNVFSNDDKMKILEVIEEYKSDIRTEFEELFLSKNVKIKYLKAGGI